MAETTFPKEETFLPHQGWIDQATEVSSFEDPILLLEVISTHSHTQIIRRSEGRDVVAKAAYNSRSNLTNLNTGKKMHHQSRGGLVYETILIPKNSPRWLQEQASDREVFWSAVDKQEIRKDAQLAREVDVGLIHEVSVQENIELLSSCVQRVFVDKGMVADIAIHEPPKGGDPRNIHAHILLTMREITPSGFGLKVRSWNSNSLVQEWRETFCNEGNRYLERHGLEPRLDHRSFKERNIDQEPIRYQGRTYRRQKDNSKEAEASKSPFDTWQFLRESINEKEQDRTGKSKEHENER